MIVSCKFDVSVMDKDMMADDEQAKAKVAWPASLEAQSGEIKCVPQGVVDIGYVLISAEHLVKMPTAILGLGGLAGWLFGGRRKR